MLAVIGTFIVDYGIKIIVGFFRFMFFLFIFGTLTIILKPLFTHFVVMRNTVTHFLLTSGMIGPMTIQFLYILFFTIFFFIIYKNVYKLIAS